MEESGRDGGMKTEERSKVDINLDAPAAGDVVSSPRDKILRLQREMRAAPNQVDIEALTRHHFANGLYARELTIPAGMCVVGKTHRGEQLNILSAGRVSLWTDEGVVTVEAPYTIAGKPGTKRAAFAHTDAVWTTIHANPTNEHDLDKLEAAYIIPETE